MKCKRFSVEQIVAVLKQAEAGVPIAELIRRAGQPGLEELRAMGPPLTQADIVGISEFFNPRHN